MLLTYVAGPLFPTPAPTQLIYLCEDVVGFLFYWVRENAACTLVRAQFHTPPVLVAQELLLMCSPVTTLHASTDVLLRSAVVVVETSM